MKILLTGSTGMVGQNILNSSEAQQHEFLTPTHSELDLINLDAIDIFIKKYQPNAIVHCAGKVGGIKANFHNNFDFYYQNIVMGNNLVISAFKNHINILLNLASSCIYPTKVPIPIKESAILSGPLETTNEGYAIAKICVAKLCEYVTKKNQNFFYKTLIPCNLYGEYDNFNLDSSHLISAIIKKVDDAIISNNQEITIWGSGKVRREFMFASDLADAIFFFLKKIKDMPQYLNIGSGIDYSVNEYYKLIALELGFKGKFVHDLSMPEGIKRKLMDVSLSNDFGWKPKISLKEGIKKTYYYYLKNKIKDK